MNIKVWLNMGVFNRNRKNRNKFLLQSEENDYIHGENKNKNPEKKLNHKKFGVTDSLRRCQQDLTKLREKLVTFTEELEV